MEGRKPENLEKNPQSKARTINKLNPDMTPDRNRTLTHICRRRALSPLRHSYYLILVHICLRFSCGFSLHVGSLLVVTNMCHFSCAGSNLAVLDGGITPLPLTTLPQLSRAHEESTRFDLVHLHCSLKDLILLSHLF